jgi:hypothetical protein
MDIIHRLMMIKIHDVSETGIFLRHQVTGGGGTSDISDLDPGHQWGSWKVTT